VKKTYTIATIAFVVFLGGVWSSNTLQNRADGTSSIVSRNGLHWHPTLEIFVRGEKVEIPPNLGLGAVHKPVHTHEDLPILHLEFSGMVREQDIMLQRFFDNWGKDMRSFGAGMRMVVNGRENRDYENYIMQDGDRIELRFD
jgi:hypothetical protein